MDLRLPTRILHVLMLFGAVPLGLAQETAETTSPVSRAGDALSERAIQAEEPALPPELKAESAIFLQRRLGEWTLADAHKLLGEPRRRRDAYEEGVVTGDIYTFRDPTSRYREFELLFDRHSKVLTAVFIYPLRMTWQDCRDLWGDEVNTTPIANGNIFRSYRSRRLDVLVDKAGNVVNLGIY